MADADKSSKTEEPTAKKLRDAHQEGNFAKAEEIQVVFGLVAAFLCLLFTAGDSGLRTARFMEHLLANLSEYAISSESAVSYGRNGVVHFSMILLPFMSAGMVAAIFAGGMQSGFKLTPKVVGFKPNKLNPINGAKQKFGPSAYVKFGFDFTKFCIVASTVALGVIRVSQHEIFYTRLAPIEIVAFLFQSTLYLLSILIIALGGIAFLNYLYQKHKTQKDLMMTKQEVKDEMKQAEGDPMVKSARMAMARSMAQRQMFSDVPNADLIITNPTHFAVALRYNRMVDSAPIVLAKGKNLIAQKIKAIGREHGVPIIENKPAARGLYKFGKTGKPIPAEMFKVVAEMLAYVYRVHRRHFAEKEKRLRREQTG